MRFDTFMETALHHPQKGYYARKIKTVGTGGDFSTTATLSPILGRALAANATTWLKQNPGPLNLIEIGAGDGSLAAAIIKNLPLPLRWKLQYHIVETSKPLTKIQQQKLGKKIHWHTSPSSALNACHGRAFIYSNELVDAFPVRILKRTKDTWQELHYTKGKEHFQPCNEPPQSSALNPNHPENHRIEIHETYRDWLEEWLPSFHEGILTTIDYGDTYPEIYHRQPNGTIRAYLHHNLLDGPAIYQNPGHQDLTADVNFTDLIQWGQQTNLKTISLQTQNQYLDPHTKNTTQDHYLTHPDGPGSAFKVLTQTPT